MKGLVHIYTGNGKGKTTAATGLMVRALGYGKKVLFVQMQKAIPSGEIIVLEKMEDIDVIHCTDMRKFYYKMSDEEKEKYEKQHQDTFKKVINCLFDDYYDLVVFDEIISTINIGILKIEEVLEFINDKPKKLEVVLTGRDADIKLIELADYVSEMKCIKHPYEKGINARKGVEF